VTPVHLSKQVVDVGEGKEGLTLVMSTNEKGSERKQTKRTVTQHNQAHRQPTRNRLKPQNSIIIIDYNHHYNHTAQPLDLSLGLWPGGD